MSTNNFITIPRIANLISKIQLLECHFDLSSKTLIFVNEFLLITQRVFFLENESHSFVSTCEYLCSRIKFRLIEFILQLFLLWLDDNSQHDNGIVYIIF